VTNPVLVVEVLSPSTEDYDRNEKVLHYKQISSLREILLVNHAARRIEHWSRGADGSWGLREIRSGESFQLSSVNCELDVNDVYRDELEL
jgi:Uma2 family endonuclease